VLCTAIGAGPASRARRAICPRPAVLVTIGLSRDPIANDAPIVADRREDLCVLCKPVHQPHRERAVVVAPQDVAPAVAVECPDHNANRWKRPRASRPGSAGPHGRAKCATSKACRRHCATGRVVSSFRTLPDLANRRFPDTWYSTTGQHLPRFVPRSIQPDNTGRRAAARHGRTRWVVAI
jgi:hypothetical protein